MRSEVGHRGAVAALVVPMVVLGLAGCAPFPHVASETAQSAIPCPSVPPAPSGEPPAVGDVATDADVAYTESSAMTAAQFWKIVGTLPVQASQHDFDALSAKLRPCGLATWVSFDARLTLLLYHLDTAPLCLWYSNNGGFPGPVYSDDFLYARADTVLAGPTTYGDALSKKELRWGESEQGTGEFLLYVAQTAADSAGESDALSAAERHDIPLSYESGTNPASASPGDPQTACIPPS